MSQPPSLVVEPEFVPVEAPEPEPPEVETPALLPLAPDAGVPLLPAEETPVLAPVLLPEVFTPLDSCLVGAAGLEEQPPSEDNVRVIKDKVDPSVEFRMSG